MSQKDGKFQSKSGKFGGGGKGKGRPSGGGFGKRFEGDRGAPKGRGGDKPFRKREFGGAAGGGDRPYKKRFEGGGGAAGGDRPFKKKWEDRGGEGGGFKGRGGDKPFRKREFGGEGGGGDRPFKKKWEDRGGDRGGFKGRDSGDKPFRKREFGGEGGGGDRPFKKKWEDRGGDRGGFKGRGEDRPFKKRFDDRGGEGGGERPFKKKWEDRGGEGGGERPFKKKWEDRGERSGGGGFKSREGGDRPFKKRFDDRGDRGGDRPFKKRFDDRGAGGGDRPFKKRFDDRGDRGGDSKARGADRGAERTDYRDRGDTHKPYKRNFGERKSFRVTEKKSEDFSADDFALDGDTPEATGLSLIETTPETRQKLKSDRPGYGAPSSAYIYGVHAVREALQNPKRTHQRLLVTENGFESVREAYEAAQNAGIKVPEPTYIEGFDLERLLPRDAVHQGILLDAQPPEEVFLSDVLNGAAENAKILVLDQVTDPHNVGAILRSAAAFGAIAVVVQKLHAPDITGTLAKSASGAVEHVPMVREVNLTRALEQLKEAGFFCVGLAEEGKETLSALDLKGKCALVLGAEGEGLRRLVAETCDALAKLPTAGPISSLNVSNAAAVALYELTRG